MVSAFLLSVLMIASALKTEDAFKVSALKILLDVPALKIIIVIQQANVSLVGHAIQWKAHVITLKLANVQIQNVSA